ncbi:MAG: hypothetical protein ABW167_16585 [Baekduia sp.]
MTIPLREPAKKSRQGGRILPAIALRRRLPAGLGLEGRGCVICGKAYGLSVENGRSFCWTHHPARAAAWLSEDTWTRHLMPAREREIPNRRTCERILRLSGRTTSPKGTRSKQKRAPRRRARWR